ncbi:MAG: hypothetical protein OJF52_000216 [Nitrospira sp.]|nr:MAG: hypothetical protein OJF52_000216 [Nitrospira sp.]
MNSHCIFPNCPPAVKRRLILYAVGADTGFRLAPRNRQTC